MDVVDRGVRPARWLRPARTTTAYGIAIDPNTCIPRWYGDKLDLDHIITGLLCIDHPNSSSVAA